MARLIVSALFFVLLLIPAPARCQEISGPDIKLNNNDISVSFSLALDPQQLREIKDGIDKELILHVDLFRIWKIWPDEFVTGKFLNRTLKSDPIKGEYVATSFNGSTLIEKRFKSFDSMISWALAVRDVKLASLRELESGKYFVRVSAESKIRKLPPVIGYFFIFLAENEFKIRKDSGLFSIEGKR